MKTTNVFSRNLDAYIRGVPTIVNQGGQGSSKTISILQLLYLIAKEGTSKKVISVVAESIPHLKLGALRDFENILEAEREPIDKIRNKSDRTYSINKSIIEFFSAEDHGKAHGPRRDILYINEANGRGISYEIFDALASRTSGPVFIDFNPRQSFWVHDEVLPNQENELIISTFMDNPYLPDKERQRILAKSDGKHEQWWRVYGLGQVGQYEGAIYTNWRTGDFDKSLPYSFGLDFGYSNPSAMCKVAIGKGVIYLDECIYKEGLSMSALSNVIAHYVKPNELIIADSADPRLIYELGQKFNIKPANKKAGSVQEGIKLIQDYELIVTSESVNLAKELNNYVWSDKRAEVPEKDFDHLMDAMRYNVTHRLMSGLRKTLIAYN